MTIEYIKGNSFLHNLDPRTKLFMFIAFTILALLILDPIVIAIAFFLLYRLGRSAVEVKRLNHNLRVLIVIFATFFLFNLIFFTPDDAHFLFYLVPFTNWVPVTVEGLIRGVAVFFRFFIVVLSVHLMLYTTAPSDLVLGLTKSRQKTSPRTIVIAVTLLAAFIFGVMVLNGTSWLDRFNISPQATPWVIALLALILGAIVYWILSRGLPVEIGLALSLGFATVGVLSKQTQKIMDAQKARGFELEHKNPLRRIRASATSMLPIFIATIERSQDITIAILARAFDYNIHQRTYRRELTFRRNDYFMVAVLGGLIFAMMIINYLNLGNPTEQVVRALLGI